jgi:von Willebrand factor A domain-containing protein 8
MPVLNNLLENREMNLEDGTHIVHPSRFSLLRRSQRAHELSTDTTFVAAHPTFRVIALGVPVPPYKGFPLDPPFRSRFQARFLDNRGSLLSLAKPTPPERAPTLLHKIRDIILAVQYASELRTPLHNISRTALSPFPQTSLQKLTQLLTHFPPPDTVPPDQLARLLLTLHPQMAHAPFEAWALLSRQFEEAGFGVLTTPSTAGLEDGTGFVGYKAVYIDRVDTYTANVTFHGPGGSPVITLNVPSGPRPFAVFPPVEGGAGSASEQLIVSNRFSGLLTCFLQSHALGWDISFVPPVLPSTATCSTALLVRTFGEVLGYDVESVHLYKEVGGREIVMRRVTGEGGATGWEPRCVLFFY